MAMAPDKMISSYLFTDVWYLTQACLGEVCKVPEALIEAGDSRRYRIPNRSYGGS